MPSLTDSLAEIEDRLVRVRRTPVSPRDRPPFEAILQEALNNASEKASAERILAALAAVDLLTPAELSQTDPADVHAILRDRRIQISARALHLLRKLAGWATAQEDGGVCSTLEAGDATSDLREQLLAINGVGRQLADRILLLALKRPKFPIDRTTARVFARHGWLDEADDLDEVQGTVESALGLDPERLSGLTLDLKSVGKTYCKASRPHCEGCPLQPLLPSSGPISLQD